MSPSRNWSATAEYQIAASRWAPAAMRMGSVRLMCVLGDTSVWIDYLRGADTAASADVRRRLSEQLDQVAICEPVAMELLAGAPDERAFLKLERLVNGLPSLGVDGGADFRTAAGIFRAARLKGLTVRSLTDCSIAAIAMRHDSPVLHKDADFEVIADITGLDQMSLR